MRLSNNISGGDYERALEYYHKALEIYERVYDESHPYVLKCKENIELLKQKQGNGWLCYLVKK